MKGFIFIFFLLLGEVAGATTVRIGLLAGRTGNAVDWNVAEGQYTMTAGGKKFIVAAGQSLRQVARDGWLLCYRNKEFLGSFKSIRIVSVQGDGVMRLRPDAQEPWYTYSGHFDVKIFHGKISIINLLDLEAYVAAVVESETGANSSPEFLKVQSVLCRTYCLSHLDRHAAEGFQLCDRVHCQVYKGKNRFNKLAEEAAQATRNKVLADTLDRLIVAAYHSNCGGMTVPADSAWSKHLDYLLPVRDTFCLQGAHAVWTAAILARDWKEYLAAATGESRDSIADSSLAWTSPGRMATFYFHGKAIPLKKIREDWKLNSTWFDIVPQGDTLLFRGRGFGHGVGLCQEGAMQMAALGKSFDEIIAFYYAGVKLADADALEVLSRQ